MDPTKLGDRVSCREPAGEHCSALDLDRLCGVICDSAPVCAVIDRLRPCTPAELLAIHDTHTTSSSPLAADNKVALMSALLIHSPTVADPSQTGGEDMDEDERDDEMPE